MGDSNKEIRIKLIIDGREATATLNITDERVESIKKKSSSALSNTGAANASREFTGMNQVIGQTGFLLSDLDMMFVNTRMGLMSISNNISMVTQTVANAANQLKGTGLTLTQAFMSALTPMNVLILTVNGVMFVLNALSHTSDNTARALDKQQDKVKELAREYENLTREQLNYQKMDVEQQLKNLETQYPNSKKFLPSFQLQRVFGGQSPFYFEDINQQKRFGDDYEKYNLLKERLSTIERTTFYLGVQEEAEIRITANRAKLKDLNKENYAVIVSGAKSEADAKEKLEKWIETDKKITEEKKNQKTIYDQLNITTEQHLLTEIKHLETLKQKEKSEYTIAAINDKILTLKKELKKYSDSEITNLERASSLLDKRYGDKTIENYIYDAQRSIDDANAERAAGQRIGRLSEGKYDPNFDYLAAGSKTIDEQNKVTKSAEMLGSAWNRTGSIISNSLSRGLGLLRQTDNEIQNILAGLAEMGIQMMFSWGMNALGAELGVPGLAKSKSIVGNTPISQQSSSGSVQYLIVSVEGQLSGAGNQLNGVIERSNNVKKKYYS
jgi:hypothetical protein